LIGRRAAIPWTLKSVPSKIKQFRLISWELNSFGDQSWHLSIAERGLRKNPLAPRKVRRHHVKTRARAHADHGKSLKVAAITSFTVVGGSGR
jgi:hypothetical protein